MNNRLIIAGVLVVAALYVFFSSIFVVDEREQAIVARFGRIDRVITEPGIYFKIPTDIVDTVQIIEDRLLRFDLANITVQVSGGAFYEVDAFLTYRITEPSLFRERAQGQLAIAEQRIGARFDSALRQVYGVREFNAALSEQRPEMMREVRDLLRPEMAALGIEIADVRILRTDLSEQVSERTYERMRAERLAQAALLRARGQEAAQSLRAIADRQSVEILAAARRDSEVLRGEGDAERSRIFADAFNADPEFFEFYRAMEAYRNALAASGTTMVLSPNTEFFSYFNSDAVQGGSGPAPAPQPQPSAPTPALAPAEDATWSDLLTGTVEPPALGGTGAGIEPTTPSDTPPSPPEAVPEPATEPNPLVPAEELGAAAPTP